MNKQHNILGYRLYHLVVMVLGVFIASPSFAATPTAYLENAQIFATGKQFQAFRVPTVDSDGKVKYYNLTIDLDVLSDGTINSLPTLASEIALTTSSNKFIPGTYSDGLGTTCTVVTTVLPGGRTEAAISCSRCCTAHLQANWITGPASKHPFEVQLRAAGIDKLSYYNNYSWGIVGNGDGNWWGCIDPNDVISAGQIGNTLVIAGFNTANVQKCAVNMAKQ